MHRGSVAKKDTHSLQYLLLRHLLYRCRKIRRACLKKRRELRLRHYLHLPAAVCHHTGGNTGEDTVFRRETAPLLKLDEI